MQFVTLNHEETFPFLRSILHGYKNKANRNQVSSLKGNINHYIAVSVNLAEHVKMLF